MAAIDPLRLDQVVANLIDNALKYSPPGSRVEVRLETPAPESVSLSVRDYGGGVPVEERERIFERFYQGRGEAYQAGLGLGLFLCRSIVELHGGAIRAEFPDDGGSRFVVELPRGLEVSELAEPAPLDVAEPSSARS
jgi:signal transduction histidine kinase